MKSRLTKGQRMYQRNWIIQFFRFIYLNLKILRIVAGGHGGTRG